MKFRPCIDLHQGQVKQIVGATLTENGDSSSSLATNFASTLPSSAYAKMYQADGLEGGHVIMLGKDNEEAAKSALAAYPNMLQIGGGITDANAREWLNDGASHVIVTSHVFHQGQIHYERLQRLVELVGKDRLVLDLSCRRRPNDSPTGPYYVVTDRWQTFTSVPVNAETLQRLSQYCCEFLVHGVDVEGLQCGILEDLVELLGQHCSIPVTYAGGVRSLADLALVDRLGQGLVDCTVGSALDIFGGALLYKSVVAWHFDRNAKSTTISE